MDASEAAREIERLKSENRALDEQVMLLVQTEQRLNRSQNELDAQLVSIRTLARFALDCSGAESPAVVLAYAVGLLARSFELDWAGALAIEAAPADARLLSGPDAANGGRLLGLDADTLEWLVSVEQPMLAGSESLREGAPAWRLARALLPPALQADRLDGGQLALAPVERVDASRPGVLVAYSAHRRSELLYGGHLTEKQLPFLELLALHTDRAIATSLLTESLRERSDQLASSLEALESTQNALLQSQKMEAIGRLAGGVAHDFNNLLTVILGYASTLTLSLPPDSAPHENARRIVEAARRASGITSQLLALGRRQVQTPESLDLAEQAQRLVDLLRRLVGEDIEIVLQFDRSLPRVQADRSQLEQILLNLVVNARDALPQGGRMNIVTRPATAADAARCDVHVDHSTFGVLEVADNGVGMDEATRTRIFEPFFTTKSAGQGTGLGLAVVYGVVRQSGGQVLVASRPGGGSAFTVLLPFAPGAVAPPEDVRPAEPEADGMPQHAATVIVAEDEPGIRGVIAAAIERAGWTALLAADGQEAIEMLRGCSPPPDLLLTDVSMPRMGGFQLARLVRDELPGVRVAFMSGYFGDRAGATVPGPFLMKPFSPEELVRFVRTQLKAPAS